MTTIKIGWTIHPQDPDYIPFWDMWKPGQPQHFETIEVDFPDLDRLDLAEAVFIGTNADPEDVPEGTPAGEIRKAIEATSYRGKGAHFSLSLGDTVEIDSTLLAVAQFGFEEVEQ